MRHSNLALLILAALVGTANAGTVQVTNLPVGKFTSPPGISGDGRIVVLGSNGNLGGTNATPVANTFTYDLLTGQFVRITADGSTNPVISADGRYIAFESSSDYVGRNDDGSDEIFRYDRTRKRFSQLTRDKEGDGSSLVPAISGDGKRVGFETSSNLRGANNDFSNEVYLYNRSGNMALSRDPNGDGESHNPALSGDGKTIAFVSTSDLTGRNADFSQELFVYDLTARNLDQITNDPEGNGDSSVPAVSGDGRFITYISSSNVAGLNPDGASAVYLRSKTGYTTLVSGTPDGPFDGDTPTINDDGKWIAFTSGFDATGNNPDHSNEILLYNRTRKTFTQITDGPSTCLNLYPKLSANGAKLAYQSNCNPTGGNADKTYEVFVADNPALNLEIHSEGPVNLLVTDPNGLTASATTSTIPNVAYTEGDFDMDSIGEDRVTIPLAVEGRYLIEVIAEAGATASDAITVDATINDVNTSLANGTVANLGGTTLGFGNQGFVRRVARLKPINGAGSRLYLGARLGHPRSASGPVKVRFTDGNVDQIFDFGLLENFGAYGTIKGTFDGFFTKLRVVNRLDGSTSVSLSAKDGDLSEFDTGTDVSMTMIVQVGPDTDMYNWRFKKNPVNGQLSLK